MGDIFISYSKQDRDLAEQLAADLESAPYEVWWDNNLITGDDFTSVIRQKIEAAKVVIVIWTHSSINSIWVKAEANMALTSGKLVAVRVAELDVQEIPLPFTLQHTSLIDEKFDILQAVSKYCGPPKALPIQSIQVETEGNAIYPLPLEADLLPIPGIENIPGMTIWYHPALIAETRISSFLYGLLSALWTDSRDLDRTQDAAYASQIEARYDFSATKGRSGHRVTSLDADEAFWVDYLGCTGDGFEATYSVASLLSAQSLRIGSLSTPLPGGQFLILGGDHCYPFPTARGYEERLSLPFRLACWFDTDDGRNLRRAFAIPGGQDLHDSCRTFGRFFCERRGNVSAGRILGRYRCEQHRSYWALKLPHNWWILGVDFQSGTGLDFGQLQYFRAIFKSAPQTGERWKIIICLPEPFWIWGDSMGELTKELTPLWNLLAEKAIVSLVIAADHHHYSRYASNTDGPTFVTAGNGGAYLSPTHWLKDKVELDWSNKTLGLNMTAPESGRPTRSAVGCWPSRSESRKTCVDVLAFPFLNYWFSACLGLFYWVMTWQFAETHVRLKSSKVDGSVDQKVIDWLLGARETINSALDVASLVMFSGQRNALLGLLGIALFATLWHYADAPAQPIRRMVMALMHWWAHVLMMILLIVVFHRLNTWLLATALPVVGVSIPPSNDWYFLFHQVVLPPFEMIFIGGIGAGFVLGAYLSVSCLLNRHCAAAFSSMRLDRYLGFLRLKIEKDKLTVYPIGLSAPPTRWEWRRTTQDERMAGEAAAYVPKRPFKPEFMEEPFEIVPSEIERASLQSERKRGQRG